MITLTASVACEMRPGGLSFVTFYDDAQCYGLTFSCYVEDAERKVEVMVADQSPYYPDTFKVELFRDRMRVILPAGTVDPVDGEDDYLAQYSIAEAEYVALVRTMTYLLAGRAELGHEK